MSSKPSPTEFSAEAKAAVKQLLQPTKKPCAAQQNLKKAEVIPKQEPHPSQEPVTKQESVPEQESGFVRNQDGTSELNSVPHPQLAKSGLSKLQQDDSAVTDIKTPQIQDVSSEEDIEEVDFSR